MPRIAVLGLHLEANAFAPPTTLEDFARQCVARGEEITALARATVSHLPAELPGFYARMDATGPWTPVPVLVAAAPPGGPIEQAVFRGFLDEIGRGLAAALPLDGVYIASHGASSAVGRRGQRRHLAALVRRIVGPAVPVVCSHDLHCNISERLVESVDAFVAYRTNPHVDMAARAAECADLLREALGGMRFARAFIRLPLAPPTVTLLTASGPYADLVRDAEALMRDDSHIANASVAGGFVYSDLPKCGITVTVTARERRPRGGAPRRCSSPAAAGRSGSGTPGASYPCRRRRSSRDAPGAESMRRSSSPTPATIPAAAAAAAPRGCSAPCTRRAAEGAVLGVFIDPTLAKEAHAAGRGRALRGGVQPRANREFSKRFAAPAGVKALRNGRGVGRRGTMAGREFNLGPSALLELEGSGLGVVVGRLRRQLHEPRMLEMHGVDIAAARSVVVKSRGHFRAGFDEFFPDDRIFEVDAPGLTSPVLRNFRWRRLPRPLFPLDPDAAWQEPDWA